MPELEDLERNGIFSRSELRIIIKKRTDMEYKLQRRVVEKEDFLKYLQYELNVDSLRRKRVQKLALKKKHSAAEIGIARRMHYVFQKALKKFGNDLKLWMQYIDFCKKTGSTASLGRAFGRLMQLHPQNATVWIMAAKYEFEENASIDNARALMQKSLRLNRDSKTLWLEYFRLELLHVDKIKKRRDILSLSTEGDQLESGDIAEAFFTNKTASIVYEKAINEFPDEIEFRLEFLPIYRLFKDTKINQDEIYDSLLKDFNSNEKAQDAVAKRPLEDLIYLNPDGNSLKDEDWQHAETLACQLYDAAVDQVKTGSMYELYLQRFLELLKQADTTEEQVSRRLRIIFSILNSADKNDAVTEQIFLVWSEMLLNIGDENGALEILSKSVQSLPIVSLYERYLSMKKEFSDDWSALNIEFETCIKKLEKTESLPIWKLWLSTCLDKNPESANEVFEKSLSSSKDVAEFGRLQYLKWTCNKTGIKAARKIFKRLRLVCPLTQDLIQCAIELELQQENPHITQVRKLHELAVDEFGKTSSECWLEFIKFELKQTGTAVANAGGVYWRALKMLDSKHVGEFVDAYTLLQARD